MTDLPEYELTEEGTEGVVEPTDDATPDGTQLPTTDDLPDEDGDAGVDDDGTEEWYGADPSNEVPD